MSLTNNIFREIELSDERMKAIRLFARSLKTNYHKRNQFDDVKIQGDSAIGKVGEWIAYEALLPDLPGISEPDMKIYTARQKSWAPDMVWRRAKIACKSCGIATVSYAGLSWITQHSDEDGYGKDEGIYGDDIDDTLFVGVEVFSSGDRGRIAMIVPVPFLHKWNMFEPTKKYDLRLYKHAINYSSFTCIGLRTGIIHPSVTELIERCSPKASKPNLR